MLRFVRHKSISTLKNHIVSGEVPVTKKLIEDSIKKDQFHELKSILKSNASLLTQPVKNELFSYISQDFSIYYLLKEHKLTPEQLSQVILHNPERVDSSWELFQRHESPSQLVYETLIAKLIKDPSDNDWAKVFHIYSKLEDKKKVEESLLVSLLEKKPDVIPYFGFEQHLLKSKLNDVAGIQFSALFSSIYNKPVDLEWYAKALDNTVDLEGNTSFAEQVKALGTEVLDVGKYNRQVILEYIEEKGLDFDSKPESLLVRLKLMEIYGMDLKDFDTLLKKFHLYQSKATFGIEFVQNMVSQSYCLKMFEDKNESISSVIEVLLLENIPIKLLQAQILSHSAFGTSRPLEIYNKYVSHVGTKPNEHTNRSPAGLLNELIITAFLYNNDREFGHLIFDKISQLGKLEELEVAIIKNVFKVYGDAFEEDSWDKAQPKLHSYISKVIRNL